MKKYGMVRVKSHLGKSIFMLSLVISIKVILETGGVFELLQPVKHMPIIKNKNIINFRFIFTYVD